MKVVCIIAMYPADGTPFSRMSSPFAVKIGREKIKPIRD